MAATDRPLRASTGASLLALASLPPVKLNLPKIPPVRLKLPQPTIDPLGHESWQAEGERRAAPLITKDAILTMLDEQRDLGRWTRWMFWAVLAAFLVGVASLAVSVVALVVLLR